MKFAEIDWATAENDALFAANVLNEFVPDAPSRVTPAMALQDLPTFYRMAMAEVSNYTLFDANPGVGASDDDPDANRWFAMWKATLADIDAKHAGVPYFAFMK